MDSSPILRENGLPRSMHNGLRYHLEFVEVAEIGSGAYGNVCKVIRKLDRTCYAMKKVNFESYHPRTRSKVLEEMWIHAELDHPNIVRLVDAWLEFGGGSETSDSEESWSSDGKDCKSERSDSGRGIDQNQLQSSPNTGSGAREKIAEEENNNMSHSISFRGQAITADSSGNEKKIRSYSPRNGTLYIQMALRDLTLADWSEEQWKQGKIPSPKVITEILIEVFKGLNYLHLQNVVHHDIKPSNILMSRSEPLMIQLADFGLACRFKDNPPNKKHGSKGTRGFAAPEQLRGECNIQSDVYSAGILLLGLLIPTQMEKAKLLEVLKKELPTDLPADYLNLFQLVSRLVQDDPGNRPTTEQVLELLLTAELCGKVKEKEEMT